MAAPALRSSQGAAGSSGSLPKGHSHLADETEATKGFKANGLERYQLFPPAWRTPIQNDAPSSGYPGVYLPHAGQQEDAVTKVIVQTGWSQKTLTNNETFSLHQKLYQNLTAQDGSTFRDGAAALYQMIVARQRYKLPKPSDATLKFPGRATLNEQKRENWLRDLADPTVPLVRLAKNVPHSFKGERMMEMLVQRQVAPDRAVWYLRAINIADVNAQRKRPNAHMKFTLDWTVEVCKFCSSILREVALPVAHPPTSAFAVPGSASASPSGASTPTGRFAGMQVKTKQRQSALTDPETRKTWVRKFSNTSALVAKLQDERLLDRPTMLIWLVDEMKRADLAQLPFVLRFQKMFQTDFALWTKATVGLVEVCLRQLQTLAETSHVPWLENVSMDLRRIVQRLFASAPDSFIDVNLWLPQRSALRHSVLSPASSLHESRRQAVQATLEVDLDTVDGRVSLLAGTDVKPLETVSSRKLLLVSILDSISDVGQTNALYAAFFAKSPGNLSEKLDVLLSWATTPLRLGNYRPIVACNLLRAVKASGVSAADLQSGIVQWLENSDAEVNTEAEDALVRVVDDLAKSGIFSPGSYFQRTVARGESDMLAAKGNGVRALLAEYMPLASASKTLRAQQRRSPTRDNARGGLSLALADLRAALSACDVAQFKSTLQRRLDIAKPTSASRKVLSELVPEPVKVMLDEMRQDSVMASCAPALLAWTFQLLTQCKAQACMSKLLRDLLAPPSTLIDSGDSLREVSDAILFSSKILRANGQLDEVVLMLFNRLEALRRHLSPLAFGSVNRMFGVKRNLARLVLACSPGPEVQKIQGWLKADIHATAAPSHNPPTPKYEASKLPEAITKEFDALLRDPSSEASAQLVSTLFWLFSGYEHWGAAVWATILGLSTDASETLLAVLVHVCEDVHSRVSGGLDHCVARAQQVYNGLASCDVTPAIRRLFLALVRNGVLSSGAVLTFYVISPLGALSKDTQSRTTDDDGGARRVSGALGLARDLLLESPRSRTLSGPDGFDTLMARFKQSEARTLWLCDSPAVAGSCLGAIVAACVNALERGPEASSRSDFLSFLRAAAGDDTLRRLTLSAPQAFFASIDVARSPSMTTASHFLDFMDSLLPLSVQDDVMDVSSDKILALGRSSDVLNYAIRARQVLERLSTSSSSSKSKSVDPEVAAFVDGTVSGLLTPREDAFKIVFARQLPAHLSTEVAAKLTRRLGSLLSGTLEPSSPHEIPQIVPHVCQALATLPAFRQATRLATPIEDDVASFWGAWSNAVRQLHARLSACDAAATSTSSTTLSLIVRTAVSVLRHFAGVSASDVMDVAVASAIIELTSGRYFGGFAAARLLDVFGAALVPQPGAAVAQLDLRLRRRYPILFRPSAGQSFPSTGLDRIRLLFGTSLRASTSTTLEKDGKAFVVEEKPWEEMDRTEPNGPGFVSLAALGAQTLKRVEAPTPTSQTPAASSEGETSTASRVLWRPGERRNFEHELDTDDLSTLPIHFMRSLAISAQTEADKDLKRARSNTISRTGDAPTAVHQPQPPAPGPSQATGKRKATNEVEIIELDEPTRQTRSTTTRRKSSSTKKGKKR